MKRLVTLAVAAYVVVAAALYTIWLVLPLLGLSTEAIRGQLATASARESEPVQSIVAGALGYALRAVPPFGTVATQLTSDCGQPPTASTDLSCQPVALPVSLFAALGMAAPPGHDEACAPMETLVLVAESCRQLIIGK